MLCSTVYVVKKLINKVLVEPVLENRVQDCHFEDQGFDCFYAY